MSLEYLTHQLSDDQIKIIENYQEHVTRGILKNHAMSSDEAKIIAMEFIDSVIEPDMKDFLLSYHDDAVRAYLISKPGSVSVGEDLYFNYWTDMEFNVGGLPGFEGYLGPKGLKENGFDPDASHMKWVKELDLKYHKILTDNPSADTEMIFLYLWRASSLISDFNKFVEIEEVRRNQGYSGGVSIESFIRYYNKSSENFDDDGNIKFDSARKIGATLSRVSHGEGLTKEALKIVCKSHKIHPCHHESIKDWGTKFLEIGSESTEKSLDN